MNNRTRSVCAAVCVYMAFSVSVIAQSPAKEYIRLGGKIVAIENTTTVGFSINGPSSMPMGTSALFTATESATWTIVSGGGTLSPSSGAAVSVTYTAVASVSSPQPVTLKAISTTNPAEFAQITFDVTPASSLTITGPSTMAASTQVLLTASQPANWSITSGGGSLSTVTNSATTTFTAPSTTQSVVIQAISFVNPSLTKTITIAVNAATLSLGSVTPNGSNGLVRTFNFSAAHSGGITASPNTYIYLMFAASASSTMADRCVLRYQPATSTFSIEHEIVAGSWNFAPYPSSTTIHGTRCILNMTGTTVSITGGVTANISVNVTFKTGFDGTKRIYSRIQADSGDTGFQDKGYWIVPYVAAPPGVASGSSATGINASLIVNVADLNGSADIKTTESSVFPDPASLFPACNLIYNRSTNQFRLYDTVSESWTTLPPGQTLSNSYCDVLSSYWHDSGLGVSMTATIVAKSPLFGANRAIGARAEDQSGAWSDNGSYSPMLAWTIPGNMPPSLVSFSPASGAGSSQTFTGVYRDGNTYLGIKDVYALINTNNSNANSCLLTYSPLSKKFRLRNNNDTAWMDLGTTAGASVSNSQCTLSRNGTSATPSGTDLTVNWNVTFNTSFSGSKNVYHSVVDLGNLNSGTSISTWSTTASSVPNGGFEAGNLSSWIVYSGAVAAPSSTPVRSGSFALETSSGNGTGVYQDIGGLTPGKLYVVSAWVNGSAGNTTEAQLYLDDTVSNVAVKSTVPGTTWQQLQLAYTATVTGIIRIHLWRGNGSGTLFWDDVTVTPTVINEGFENGNLNFWSAYPGVAAAVNQVAARSGFHGAELNGGNHTGIYQDIGGLEPGQLYTVTGWVKGSSGNTTEAYLSLSDSVTGIRLVSAVPGAAWQQLRLAYTATSTGTIRIHLWRGNGSGTLYWDDVSLTPVATNQHFETANLNTWAVYPGVTATATTTAARSGSYGAELTSGAHTGIYQDVGGLQPGQMYTVTCWVKGSSGNSTEALLSLDDTVSDIRLVSAVPGTFWQQLQLVYTATSTGIIRIHLWRGNGAGTLYWDDVTVTPTVANEGFENANLNLWAIYPGATAAVNATSVRTGSYGAEVSSGTHTGIYQDVGGLEPGRLYTITCWVKGSSGNTAEALLSLDDTITGIRLVSAVPGTSWQPLTLTYLATSTHTIRIHLWRGGSGTGIHYWDDVSIRPAVENAMFELGSNLPSWNVWTGATAAATSGSAHAGNFGVGLDGGSNTGIYQDIQGLEPGQQYKITAWVKGSPGNTTQAQLYLDDTVANVVTSNLTPTETWQQVPVFYTATSAGIIRIHLWRGNGSGTLYWDDVDIEAVP